MGFVSDISEESFPNVLAEHPLMQLHSIYTSPITDPWSQDYINFRITWSQVENAVLTLVIFHTIGDCSALQYPDLSAGPLYPQGNLDPPSLVSLARLLNFGSYI